MLSHMAVDMCKKKIRYPHVSRVANIGTGGFITGRTSNTHSSNHRACSMWYTSCRKRHLTKRSTPGRTELSRACKSFVQPLHAGRFYHVLHRSRCTAFSVLILTARGSTLSLVGQVRLFLSYQPSCSFFTYPSLLVSRNVSCKAGG